MSSVKESVEWPAGSGEMARRIREYDWAATPLGPIADWPQSTRTAVDLMLASGHAMQLAWGSERTVLYNDAYVPMLGEYHPRALGIPFCEAWPDIWEEIEPLVERTFAGETVRFEGMPLIMARHGYNEETWWNFSYSPVRDESGSVAGLLNVTLDATARVRADRAERERDEAYARLQSSEKRQAFLLELSDKLRPLGDPVEIRSAAAKLLGDWLGATRVYYVECDAAARHATVARDYVADGLPSLAGRYDGYRTVPERLSGGHTWIVDDVAADPEIAVEEREVLAAQGIIAWIDVPLIKAGKLVAILCAVQGAPRKWADAEVSLVEETAERTWSAVQRARAEAALRESEERFRQFGEASSDVLWMRDADQLQWTYLTPAFDRIYGVGRDEALKGDNFAGWTDLILPEDREHAAAEIERVRKGERVTFEYRIRRPSDGAVRWLRNTDFPLLDSAGRVHAIGGIGHDVTERKETAERMEILVAELQHRTRNLIGVVRAIASQTLDLSETPDQFRAEFDGRMRALSGVQGLLSRSDLEPITIGALIDMELSALGAAASDGKVAVQGPEVRLRNSIVQTLALAIHELATNARKHGALSTRDGRLAIRWRLAGEDGGQRLDIEWLEEGIKPQPAPQVGSGYGRMLIEKALPYSLDARTRFELSDTRLRCEIDLPLER